MYQTALQTSFHPDAEVRSLEDQITELAAHIHAATFRFLEPLREFDERNGWCGPGSISTLQHQFLTGTANQWMTAWRWTGCWRWRRDRITGTYPT